MSHWNREHQKKKKQQKNKKKKTKKKKTEVRFSEKHDKLHVHIVSVYVKFRLRI